MTLSPGTRLGPFEILAPLGAGGMGEVYRAHVSRLGRDVGIKMPSPGLAATPEVRARFEREARTILPIGGLDPRSLRQSLLGPTPPPQ